MNRIRIEEALQDRNILFVDVRSPKEFAEDHIPGAINIPILDNEERAIIGTLYKHEGKDSAVQKGLEFVTPKLEQLYNQLKELSDKNKVVIYCFRGGMRSSSVVDFASSCDVKVHKLDGGYKAYRRYVISYFQTLSSRFLFTTLHGNTGVGKTQMLLELQKCGEAILDLEFFAKNSGSVFGDLYYEGNAPSQKFFETSIFEKLYSYEQKNQKVIFLESESKKIGRCTLPAEFWEMMQSGKHILVEASMKNRVRRCVEDYTQKQKNDDEGLIQAISRLKDKLGNKKTAELIELVQQKNYDEVAEFLMEQYYDRLYLYSQDQYDYEFTVSSDQMQESVEKIIAWSICELVNIE